MKRRRVRRGLAAVVGLCAVAAATTAAGAPDPTYPNLPAVVGTLRGARTDTIGYVSPSRQWIRVPRVLMAVDANSLSNDPGSVNDYCVQQFSATTCTPARDAYQRLVVYARAYPVQAATQLTQSHFSNFPAAKVRMVAFGTIPIEATVHLSLPTDAGGLPQGILAYATTDRWMPDMGPRAGGFDGSDYQWMSESTVTGRMEVRLSDLTVDGVPVDVGPACKTSAPATLDGRGVGYWIADGFNNQVNPPGTYNPYKGGRITGTLDLPRFTGCGVDGDDLDAMITAMASGDGLPVAIEQGVIGLCWAPNPALMLEGNDGLDGRCGDPAKLDFPSRNQANASRPD